MKFYCFNRNKNYQQEIENIFEDKKKEIFDFFGQTLDDLDFNIYIYDTIEELINGLKNRGFKDMPSYMCACQKDEDNSLNFFEPKDSPSENEWSKAEYEKVIFRGFIVQFVVSVSGRRG